MDRMSVRKMMRVFLMALLCLVPVITVYRLNRTELLAASERSRQDAALQRAERFARSFRMALNDTVQTAVTAARLPWISTPGPDSDAALAMLVAPPSAFRVFLIGNMQSGIVGASDPALKGPRDQWPSWVRDTLAMGDGVPHALTTAPGLRGPFLPVAVRLAPLTSTQPLQFVIVGIDPAWIMDRIDRQLVQPTMLPNGQSVLLMGRNDTLLMGISPTGEISRPLPPSWLTPSVLESGTGLVRIPRPTGGPYEIIHATTEGGPAAIDVVMPAPWADRLEVPIVAPAQRALAMSALLMSFLLVSAALWWAGSRRRSDVSPTGGARETLATRITEAPPAVQPPVPERVDSRLAAGLLHKLNNALATVQGNLDLLERMGAGSIVQSDDARSRLQRSIARAAEGVLTATTAARGLDAVTRDPRQDAQVTDMNALIQRATILAQGANVSTHLAADLWPALIRADSAESALLRLCLDAREMLGPGESLSITSVNQAASRSAVGGGTAAPDRIAITFDIPAATGRLPPGWEDAQSMGQAFGPGVTSTISTVQDRCLLQLLLPRAGQPAAHARPVALAMEAVVRPLVLVVDDDDAVRRVTVEMLLELGCEVEQASNGEDALILCRRLPRPPDLALIDHIMPGIRGTELARQLRTENLARRLVLATGYADIAKDPTRDGVLEAVLRKPFAIHELQRLLGQRADRAPDIPRECQRSAPISAGE